jgi:hydrogenase expression/formation protein HypC
MCLAIPAKIETFDDDNMATVSVMGVKRSASLDLIENAKIGDYVLVHAGFAIEIVDEDLAKQTLDLVKEMPEFAEIS